MNIAFYFVAIGEGTAACMNLAHDSLRRHGYDGDVFILTDKKRLSYDAASERTQEIVLREGHLYLGDDVDAPEALIDVRKLRNEKRQKWAIVYVKPCIDMYIDITRYDYIVLLDADVLTTKPIEPLFDLLEKRKKPFFVGTSQALLFRSKPCNENLTRQERLRYWTRRGINTGIVCFPGEQRSIALLQDWRAECSRGIHGDQAALQAVLLRKHRDQFAMLPHSIMGYGPSPKREREGRRAWELKAVDSVFVHIKASIRYPRRMFDYYDKYINRKIEA